MSDVRHAAVLGPLRLVAPAVAPRLGRRLRFALEPADRPLVAPGQRVEAGQAIIEHFREQEALEIPTTAALVGLRPGDILDHRPVPSSGRLGRRAPQRTYRARVCEHGRDGMTRLAAGSSETTIQAPAVGLVEAVMPGHVDFRVDGLSVEGRVGWGRSSAGRVVVAVDDPGGELAASRIDIAAAGAILVVGARIDVEAISRARALGVAGVISGGLSSRDLRQLRSSEARQRAALHAAAPFSFLALGGYGRAPIPRHLWDLLVAADGRPAGIAPHPRALIIGGDPAPLLAAARRPPGTVRVVGGRHRDREGLLVGLAGPRRWSGSGYAPGAFVELVGEDGPALRCCLPVSMLERLG